MKTRYLQRVFFRSDANQIRCWLLSIVSDLLLTFAAFWLALTLVPQLFYMFYRIIIPGLPLQWVLAPLSFKQVLQLLAIDQAEMLSGLAAGLLLSTLLVAISWSWLLLCPIRKKWHGY